MNSVAAPRSDLSTPVALVWISLALVLGAALRVAGLSTDFWLDEVWSWSIAGRLDSPLQVFTAIHHSNNHHLLTLWMFLLGDAAPVWLYRLPSLIAGLAAMPLVAALAWRRGRLEAALAVTAVSVCFALVHFASEARGYALAVAFALAAQLCLLRALESGDRRAAVGFGGFVALGLLVHLGSAFYWAGAGVQSLWQLRGLGVGDRVRRLAALHALPAIALVALYAVDLRELAVGGGNPTDLPILLARTAGFAFGAPVIRSLGLTYILIIAVALAAAAATRARRSDDSWIGDLVTILAAPLLVLALLRPDVIAVRYFLIGITLALLLLADLLAGALRSGGMRRVVGIALGIAFLMGNALHLSAFLEHGRGGFRAALLSMAAADPNPEIRVGSDHDFRNGSVLRFYARELPEDRALAYFPRDRHPPAGPEWMILHRAQRPARISSTLTDAAGHRYALFSEFDHAAISGFYWALYRNERSSTSVPNP